MINSTLRKIKHRVEQFRLEAGEKGSGKPAPPPLLLKGIGADKCYTVGVIGAGPQGLKQVKAIQKISGIKLGALVDISADRLAQASELGIPDHVKFTDTEDIFRLSRKFDLISIATTAPTHVKLGRLALNNGVKKILLEKPFDTSLTEARQFVEECVEANAELSVNYSRRWMIDYQAIARCIENGFIGSPRSIGAMIGQGELAMHASHYFDLCNFILKSEPVAVVSRLTEPKETNSRGAEYSDPCGYCLITYENGSRSFIDFSEDLGERNPLITIKGTIGQIMVDEKRGFWTLQSRSQRIWSFPFVEPIKAEIMFSRVICDLLSLNESTPKAYEGISTLELIFAAHLSNAKNGEPVALPLGCEQELPQILFP